MRPKSFLLESSTYGADLSSANLYMAKGMEDRVRYNFGISALGGKDSDLSAIHSFISGECIVDSCRVAPTDMSISKLSATSPEV